MKDQIRKTFISAAAICLLLAPTVQACTGIRLIAEDGTVIHARTMEFAIDIHSDVMMIPRGYVRTGTTPDGKEGLKWKTKYASVGLNGVGLPVLFDGLNEKGLAAGTFYFPTSRRIPALHRSRCEQDHCTMGSGIMDIGELRQRRGSEG